ncbi:FecR domain-containing protein [Sphingobium sp. AN558]|uniref:FecR family protein n=1 Tax=Sphingobium sp. AN558 TaxID=3133442 RepID=UPI0030C00ED4
MTAKSEIDERMLDQALAWQAALEQDDADWDGYMAWLEADPCHREAFDSVALVTAAVDDHRAEIGHLLAAQVPAQDPRKRFSRVFAYAGGGLAAAIALMVAVPMLWTQQVGKTYSAEAGASRTVALANGITVTLSPASSIVVHGKDGRQIDLAGGEAHFDVRHNPSRSLTVSAVGYTISDIGTRFSVTIGGNVFRVGVSDGNISVASPDASEAVQVSAGHQLIAGGGDLTLSPVLASDVGSWRSGRLSYSSAPLSLVAADISRYSRKSVKIDPSLEASHFSGTLVIGDGTRLLPDLAGVMGVRIVAEGNGARIAAR